MAKKRRLKRPKGPREALPPAKTKSNTMSSDDSNPIQSGRQSSDGTLSENATSDGVQTSMTSIMDTDEDQDTDEVDQAGEGASTYPVSHYPRPSSQHRTEMPYSADSQGGSLDMAASTRSLWAQDLDYRDIHGRRYCRDYYMPNDEIEQLRLALTHQVFLHVLEGELTSIPLEDPTHILDVGTGTGEWAIKLAELFPNCEVVGTDISAIAETSSVPMNVFFEIEDAEDWDRQPDTYDLIHFRYMEGAFRDWPFMYDNVFYSLKPGGWVEMLDFDTDEGLHKFYSQFSDDSPIHAMFRDLDIAAERVGRKRGTTHLDPRLLMECGFVDVRVTEYVIPITVAEKSAGKIWLITCLDAMEALCLRLLTQEMGWEPDKCKAACESAARELANLAKDPEKSKGLLVKLRVVAGRKPFDAPLSDYPRTGDTRSPSIDHMEEDSSQPTELGANRESPSPSQAGSVPTEIGAGAGLETGPALTPSPPVYTAPQ